MADFNIEGIDSLTIGFMRRSGVLEETMNDCLEVGSNLLVEAQKKQAESMKIHDTGDMIKSIKATKQKKDKDGNPYVDIYPQGKDRKGTRNAEKGFIAEYGKSDQPARPWMRTANEKANDEVQNAIWETFNEHMGNL